jgi:Coenzyme PQQ synthesis protein D (PqqD)
MTHPRPTTEEMRVATVVMPNEVVHRRFEAQTLLLNIGTSQYHGLNPTGGRILELVQESGGQIADATRRLAEEYRVDAEEIAEDVASFCADLVERGIIRLASADDVPDRP